MWPTHSRLIKICTDVSPVPLLKWKNVHGHRLKMWNSDTAGFCPNPTYANTKVPWCEALRHRVNACDSCIQDFSLFKKLLKLKNSAQSWNNTQSSAFINMSWGKPIQTGSVWTTGLQFDHILHNPKKWQLPVIKNAWEVRPASALSPVNLAIFVVIEQGHPAISSSCVEQTKPRGPNIINNAHNLKI